MQRQTLRFTQISKQAVNDVSLIRPTQLHYALGQCFYPVNVRFLGTPPSRNICRHFRQIWCISVRQFSLSKSKYEDRDKGKPFLRNVGNIHPAHSLVHQPTAKRTGKVLIAATIVRQFKYLAIFYVRPRTRATVSAY